MKYIKYFILIGVLAAVLVLPGCKSVGVNYGVSIHSGPHGPSISPSMNIGIGGGSGWYW